MTEETTHTCSYSCERPGCIRAQRDYLAARLTAPQSAPVGVDFAAVASILRRAMRDGTHYGNRRDFILQQALALEALSQQPAAAGEESSKGADVAKPKRRRYDPYGSLSEYGIFPECDAQQIEDAQPPSQESEMDEPIPETVLEAVARAICVACGENPDHRGDARGNEFRWQDYRNPALAAISALATQQQGDKA